MIKHKDTIILVTFTVDDWVRYERLALQSADCAFVKSVNPVGYKFAGVEAVREFLREQKELILRNRDEDEFSYFKFFVLGPQEYEKDEDGEVSDVHMIGVWRRGAVRIPYKDIVIEKAVAFDKATDTETDITEEFKAVWDIGRNPPERIKNVWHVATVRCTVDAKVYVRAPSDTPKAKLIDQARKKFTAGGDKVFNVKKISALEITSVILDEDGD